MTDITVGTRAKQALNSKFVLRDTFNFLSGLADMESSQSEDLAR